MIGAGELIVVGGIDIAVAICRALDADIEVAALVTDGDQIEADGVLMRLDGNGRAMLAAERSALNTLQHLSGVATLTRPYGDGIAGPGATLVDTRKTIPDLPRFAK